MAVLISTTDSIPGYKTVEYKGLVWSSSARSKHIGSDFAALGTSLFGGEITQYKKLLNEGRNDMVQGIVKNAELIGANAVVGVRFGTTQIMPATLDIFAYGTAVVIAPEHTHHHSASHPAHHSPKHHAGHHVKHKRR